MISKAKQRIFDALHRIDNIGVDLGIDSNSTGIAFTNKAGSAYRSERYNPKEAYAWLQGFLTALNIKLSHTGEFPPKKLRPNSPKPFPPKNKPTIHEDYKGYVIQLDSTDWDADFTVISDGKPVTKQPSMARAKEWVDAQL